MAEGKDKSYPLLLKRVKKDKKELEKKRRKAIKEAEKAARILKEEFQAEKVWLFGSLADKEKFWEKSDIDLAASGIPPEKFYKAMGYITRKTEGFQIDLVDIDDCRKSLRKAIKEDGKVI